MAEDIGGKQILTIGDKQHVRYSPASTFKIVLSLIGFNEGILTNEMSPRWPFKKGYDDYLKIDGKYVWKQSHNPTTWIQYSCLWYSKLIAQKAGIEKIKTHLAHFSYGNQDVSSNKDANYYTGNPFWISGSLKISLKEQIVFLKRLLQKDLTGITENSYEMTYKILRLPSEDVDGWKIYGKAGAAHAVRWFVGWAEKNGQKIVFACNYPTEGRSIQNKDGTFIPSQAKIFALEKLRKMLPKVNVSST